jgi:peroxiredoxin
MLEAGQEAPDFTLPDQDNSEVTLSELRGQTVVL